MLFTFLVISSACGQTLPDEVRISYASLNKPLSLVLKELSEKSGININYSENRIPKNKKISISVQNETVGDILTVIFRDIDYSYQIIGDQIVIVKDNARGEEQFFTISGYVKDKKSGEHLVYANVYTFDKTKGTQSNEEGFFSITLPRGTQRLYYSYIGYDQTVKEYLLLKDVEETIYLNPDVQLNEVIILEDVENREEETTASENNLYLNQILTASTLGGESDIIRLVNMMPGVNSGADGLGGMNIRGGSADQNLVMLDGAPVYNPGHALGLFSIFNSDVVKNAKLLKGNIPARYGGRLSSVLDVRTRDGNTQKTSGAVSLSTLAVKGFVEGPMGSNGSSYLITARRTFLDPWIKSLTEYINDLDNRQGFSTYYFADVNAKLNFKINKRHSFLLSGFLARDDFESSSRELQSQNGLQNEDKSGVNWNWGNNMIIGKLKSQLSNKAFSTLSFYYTDFEFESFDYDSYYSELSQDSTVFTYKAGLFSSAIQDVNISYAIDYIPNTKNRVRAGVNFTQHRFTPGLNIVGKESDLFTKDDEITAGPIRDSEVESQIIGNEIVGYIEDEITFSYGTMLNVGLHTNFTMTDGKNYLNLQPRVSFLTRGENMYFKIGVSKMNQYLHLLSNNGLGLPSDIWLPSTEDLGPESSWIFSSGLGYKNKQGYQWGTEVYYKVMNNLTSFGEAKTIKISEDTNLANQVPIGNGLAYGAELYFNKIIGRTTWNANYTIAFSDRNFPDLNTGREFRFRYDRRHNIKLGFFHKITDNTEFVMNWTYATGNPITYPTNITIDINEQLTPVYTEKNNLDLAPYHRLDFSFNFYSKLKWARQKFSLGLYNAFNRKNQFFVDVDRPDDGSLVFERVEFSILPVFPVISYSLSFN